jgi:replicative DNA helicase
VEHPPRPTLTRVADLRAQWEAEAVAAHEAHRSGQLRGPRTPFPKLNEVLGGFWQPGIHIVHGPPGTGKTAWSLQAAADSGCPSLFVSCEMPKLELLRRLTARATGIYLGRLKSGELRPEEMMAAFDRMVAACPSLVLADATHLAESMVDAAFRPTAWLREAAEVTRGDAQHVLVVLDSIHTWTEAVAPAAVSEYEGLNSTLSALRPLTHTLGCPLLVVSERNRASMNSGGLHAGAGSRKLEYSAETVLDLECDAKAQPDANGEIAVTLKVAKNRHGAPRREVELRFHGAKQSFREAF